MFSKLFTRLFATYLLLFALIIAALAFSLTYLFRQYYYSRTQRLLLARGEQLNRILEGAGPAEWEKQVAFMEELLNARIVARRVAPEQAADLERLDFSAFGEEHLVSAVREILAGETVVREKFYSPALETDVVFAGLPLFEAGEVGGFILLFAPLTEVRDTLGIVNRVILTHALGGTLLAAVLIFIASRRIIRPLGELEGAARQMARGDFPGPVKVRGKDEVARLAETFNNMAGRLARNEEVRRELFTDISHELRAPVTTVRGFLQALMEEVVPEEQRGQYMELAYREAGRLALLVNDLLELAKLQSGELILEREEVPAEALLEEVVRAMALRAAEKGVDLSLLNEGGVDKIYADPNRLRQVLVNLLDNALRHTGTGGAVWVKIAAEEGGVLIRVEDSGCGIPPEELPFIFEKFYRVDPARGATSGGAGLGLHIVKKLVEVHGGRVTAQSTPGRGTTIGFWLPGPGASV